MRISVVVFFLSFNLLFSFVCCPIGNDRQYLLNRLKLLNRYYTEANPIFIPASSTFPTRIKNQYDSQ